MCQKSGIRFNYVNEMSCKLRNTIIHRLNNFNINDNNIDCFKRYEIMWLVKQIGYKSVKIFSFVFNLQTKWLQQIEVVQFGL